MEGEKVETGLEFQMTKGELAEYWLFRVFAMQQAGIPETQGIQGGKRILVL